MTATYRLMPNNVLHPIPALPMHRSTGKVFQRLILVEMRLLVVVQPLKAGPALHQDLGAKGQVGRAHKVPVRQLALAVRYIQEIAASFPNEQTARSHLVVAEVVLEEAIVGEVEIASVKPNKIPAIQGLAGRAREAHVRQLALTVRRGGEDLAGHPN